ncbi:hypothetical protein [Edaphobacter aggregans]|uniref:hypothetical protein n=1 Tax=Edaphobacter aggregans TaxID=570835 RepID=UPI0012FC431A|nr:hypothetical protein [Edaphobacter aggregans]
MAKGPEPAERIPLEPLGFQPLSTQFLLAGSSMLTVDFVDDKHLLLTYSTKRLLKRLPDCPPTDQDRMIDAVLLEVPGGKVLARTSWRFHDHGQYLWNLGKGRFMLRTRDTLTTFAPMVNLARGHAFRERPFLTTERRIGGVLLSPDADLMIIETVDRQREAILPTSSGATPGLSTEESAFSETPVQINFFRLSARAGEEVGLRPGGGFRARVPGRIPANSAGYVAMLDQGQRRWAFDFHSYSGKVKELAAFDSTCRPVPILVSRSEFIAFGCGLNHAPQLVGAFNMRGEQMWQQNLTESYIAPTFDYAPKGGRFAMSRVLTHSGVVQADALIPELVAGQSIIVYQTDSGRQVLRIDASPVERAGQNFALSPDGMSLAVVRGDAIEIHSLPPLTEKERDAVKLAEASAPQDDGAMAQFGEASAGGGDVAADMTNGDSANPPAQAPEATPAAKTSEPEVAQPPTPQAAPAPPAGTDSSNDAATSKPQESPANTAGAESSAPTESPRKPPTLYNEGEHPGDSSGTTQKPGSPKQ